MVARLDRLTRSLRDFLVILDRVAAAGATFTSLGDPLDGTTDIGRAVMAILMTFAEYERALLRRRTEEGLARARAGPGRRADRATPASSNNGT